MVNKMMIGEESAKEAVDLALKKLYVPTEISKKYKKMINNIITLQTFKKKYHKNKPKDIRNENWLEKIGFYKYMEIPIKESGGYNYHKKRVLNVSKELFKNNYNILIVYFLFDKNSYNQLREFNYIDIYFTINEDIINEINNSR